MKQTGKTQRKLLIAGPCLQAVVEMPQEPLQELRDQVRSVCM